MSLEPRCRHCGGTREYPCITEGFSNVTQYAEHDFSPAPVAEKVRRCVRCGAPGETWNCKDAGPHDWGDATAPPAPAPEPSAWSDTAKIDCYVYTPKDQNSFNPGSTVTLYGSEKSPAELIDAVLEAAEAMDRSLHSTRLSKALWDHRAAGSPKAADLEKKPVFDCTGPVGYDPEQHGEHPVNCECNGTGQVSDRVLHATVARLSAELAEARKHEAANLKAEIAAETALIAARAELEAVKAEIVRVRPLADCYERALQTFGLEKDLIGYTSKQKALAEKRRAWISECGHRYYCSISTDDGRNYPCTCGRDAALDGGKE